MLFGIELDENGNTEPLTDNRAKAMAAARRKAIKNARELDSNPPVHLLTFSDNQPNGKPNNASNAIGQMVFVGNTTPWGDSAAIEWTDGVTNA